MIRPAASTDRYARIASAAGWLSLLAFPVLAVVAIERISDSAASRPRVSPPAPRAEDVPIAPPPAASRDAEPVAARVRLAPTNAAPGARDGGEPHTLAEQLVDRALATGDEDAAGRERLLRAALDLDPYNVRALAALCSSLSGRQADRDAHEIAQRCVRVDPTNPECATVLVRSDMREGDWQAARDEIDTCLALEPRPPECVLSLARLRVIGHDANGASATLGLIGDAGVAVERETLLADIAREQGHGEEARAHYRAACEMGQAYACRQLEPPSTTGADVPAAGDTR